MASSPFSQSMGQTSPNASKCWSDQTDPPPEDWWQDTPGEWEAPELPLDNGYTLVLDGDDPHELADFPTFSVG